MASHADRQIALAEERDDTDAAERWRRIKARVDAAPPLSAVPAVRDRLAVLLRPPAAEVLDHRQSAAKARAA